MSSTRSPRRLRTVLGALSVSLVLFGAACSASGDDDAADGTTTTTEKTSSTTTEGPDDTSDDFSDDTSDDFSDDTSDDFSDDTSDDLGGMNRDDVVDAIATQLVADGTVPNLDQPTAECLASEMVDIVGVEQLQEIGMSGFTGIDQAEAEEFAQSWGDCGYDLRGFMVQSMTDSGATAAQAECVYEQIGDETVEELLALGFAGGSDTSAITAIQQRVQAAAAGCR